MVHVPNQLIWSTVGSNLTMECFIEASPRSMNFWVKGAGELILSGSKYTLSDVRDSIFAGRMALTIHSFQNSDVGTYRCVAKNSLGEVEGRIQVYGKPTLITDAPPRTSLGLSSQLELNEWAKCERWRRLFDFCHSK